MTDPALRNDQAIRSRLLNRLGIYDERSVGDFRPRMTATEKRRLQILRNMGVHYSLPQTMPDGSAIRELVDRNGLRNEALKGDDDDDDDNKDDGNSNDNMGTAELPAAASVASTTSSISNDNTDGTAKQTRLRFKNEVDVIPIPMRNEYSNRIKSRIWSNAREIKANAERNAVEFAAEGWDWRNVMEDESMFIDSRSGELVHPVHVHINPR